MRSAASTHRHAGTAPQGPRSALWLGGKEATRVGTRGVREMRGVEAAWAAARRAGRIGTAGGLLAGALWLGGAGGAAAEAEWCDDGSPPPNDFRLQPTGGYSDLAPPYWLRSTDNGDALLTIYILTGVLDVSQVGQLSGGVATGMTTAAGSTSTADARR